MKQIIFMAIIAFSMNSCGNASDSSTPGASTDSTNTGTGSQVAPATVDTSSNMHGDTTGGQGRSSSSGDTSLGSQRDATQSGMPDTSMGKSQSGSRGGKNSKDTSRGKKNHYPDSSKRRN